MIEADTLETDLQRQALSKEIPGEIVIHNTSGEGFAPIAGCWNIALPVHEWSRYPEPWSRRLNCFDEIWVTSQHVYKILLKSNVHKPILFLPPGLDTCHWRGKTEWKVRAKPHFYFCGESHFRKGHHLLINGFLRAFPATGEALLTIKTNSDCDWEAPRADIIFDKRKLDRQQMLETYANYDFYISASLGEGLGLPVAEAILSGLPIAANFWGGHTSLLKRGSFFKIAHRLIDQPFSSRPEYYALRQKCALSDSEAVSNTLKIIKNYTKAEGLQRMAHSAKEHLLCNYGIVNAGRKIKCRLEQIQTAARIKGSSEESLPSKAVLRS